MITYVGVMHHIVSCVMNLLGQLRNLVRVKCFFDHGIGHPEKLKVYITDRFKEKLGG